MPLRTQPATRADLESILLLMRRLQQADPWEQPFDEVIVRANLEELLQNAAYGAAHLVWDGPRPVAYLVVCFDFSLEYRGKGAWIDELFVEDDYRGQGIGSQLLDLAEDFARQQGARTLHLEVNHGNRAIELYRRRGFEDHNRYLMTKKL
jgi:diamine N-acetyltransferase